MTALNQQQMALCREGQGICQNLQKEVEALLSEPILLAIDLQSLMPPLHKLQLLFGKEAVFQELCAWIFQWYQVLQAQQSNASLKTATLYDLERLAAYLCMLVNTAQQQGIWPEQILAQEPGRYLADLKRVLAGIPEAAEPPKKAKKKLKEKVVPSVVSKKSEPAEAALTAVINPALASIFYEEVDELLMSLQEALRRWQAEPEIPEPCACLKRDLHTLKGAARTVGLSELGAFVNEMESILAELESKGQRPDGALFVLLQEAFDCIASTVDQLKAHGVALSVAAWIARTQNYRARGAAESKSEIVALKAVAVEPLKGEPQSVSISDPHPAPVAEPESITRVNTELLEQLSNLASVTNVSGVNLAEELTQMGRYVHAVVDSVTQLQNDVEALFRESASEQAQQDLRLRAEHLEDMNTRMQTALEHAEHWLLEQQRAAEPLQEGLTGVRMEPFSILVPRLERLVRQVSRELNKEVQFVIEGQERPCDRKMLDRLLPSLEHMLRNALDHGLESVEERLAAGKPVQGTIALSIRQMGSQLLVYLKDDGRGIDAQRIRQKAESLGWMKPNDVVSEESLIRLILKPGFSTRDQVTAISGRGVGMDVVNNEVSHLGGTFTIQSTVGQGTLFKIVLPFTLSLSRVLLFEVAHQWYGVQLTHIEGIVRLPLSECRRHEIDHQPLVYAHHHYQLVSMSDILGVGREKTAETESPICAVLLLRVGNRRLAARLDGLIGAREVVIHSLGPQLQSIALLNGATILGDGRIVFILDGLVLAQQGLEQNNRILVVDDSATIRRSLEQWLKSLGYPVGLAADGQEALDQMRLCLPALVLLDLDMPRVDGFAVIRAMRAESALQEVPIIVISSRTEHENREKALALGANRVLAKPYRESELLGLIRTYLKETV